MRKAREAMRKAREALRKAREEEAFWKQEEAFWAEHKKQNTWLMKDMLLMRVESPAKAVQERKEENEAKCKAKEEAERKKAGRKVKRKR